MPISLVSQGPSGYAQGTAAIPSGTFTVTLQQAPITNNVLILTYISNDNLTPPTITGISQLNVAWTPVAVSSGGAGDAEIWKGVVSAGAGTVITITVTGGTVGTGEIADVTEWNGLSSTVDQISQTGQGHSTITDTSTTPLTTQPKELWIGVTGGEVPFGDATQSSPTNGFALLDGVDIPLDPAPNHFSLALLYKITSSTGTANSGTTVATSMYWAGAIATFPASVAPIPTGTITITALLAGIT